MIATPSRPPMVAVIAKPGASQRSQVSLRASASSFERLLAKLELLLVALASFGQQLASVGHELLGFGNTAVDPRDLLLKVQRRAAHRSIPPAVRAAPNMATIPAARQGKG
ncbi:MAG: hypothetical protein JO227_12495 [Acetobacteraceae bacterium]|nr:hypothetical protein [Acetobacteraceae bacterium]